MLLNNKVGCVNKVEKKKQHFSIRKLSVGAASVLIGTTFYLNSQGSIVHADTLTNAQSKVAKNSINEPIPRNNQATKAVETKVQNIPNDQKSVDKTNVSQTIKVQPSDNTSLELASNKIQVKPDAKITNSSIASPVTYAPINVNDWDTKIDDANGEFYLKITGYHGSDTTSNLTIPNGADFARAGENFLNWKVGISSDTLNKLIRNGVMPMLSGTDDQKIKAEGSNWFFAFYGKGLYNINGLANLDTTNITAMSDMFGSNQINDLSALSNWDVSNVTNMTNMFASNQINDLSALSNWDVSNVTNMTNMFTSNQINDLSALSNWDVSNVTDMTDMFTSNQINDLSALSNWNVSNVISMMNMFSANKISNLGLVGNWNVGNVKDMGLMFFGNRISDLTPLSNWNVSNVIDMQYMLAYNRISDLTPLSNWNVSNVGNMAEMFDENTITSADLAKWNFSKLEENMADFSDTHISNSSVYVSGSKDMISPESQAVIYLGDNNTIPSWFLEPVSYNENIFSTSNGNHLIVTSNAALLANPNKAFNKLKFSDGSSANIPVFINAKNDKADILNTVKSFVNQAIHTKKDALEQANPNKIVTLTLDTLVNQSDPIALANAKVNINMIDKPKADNKKTSSGTPLVQEDLPTKHIVVYKDKNGEVVGTQEVKGKVGDKVTLNYPDGYTSADNETEKTLPADGVITIDNVIKKTASTTTTPTSEVPKKEATGTPLVQESLPTKHIVIYKDKNGEVVGTQEVDGKAGDKVTLNYPDGYTSADNETEKIIPADGVITIDNVIKKTASTTTTPTSDAPKKEATESLFTQENVDKESLDDTDETTANFNSNKVAFVDHIPNHLYVSTTNTNKDITSHKVTPSSKYSKLPQTGTDTSILALAFGTLISGLGLLGLRKSKKHS